MQTMLLAAELVGAVTGIIAGICLLVRPIRNGILGLNETARDVFCGVTFLTSIIKAVNQNRFDSMSMRIWCCFIKHIRL